MATFKVTGTSETSITVKVSGLSTTYKYNRDFYWDLDGDNVDSTLTVSNTVTEVSYTFKNLSPGTSYTLSVRIHQGGTTAEIASFDVDGETDDESTPTPDSWSWTSSNGSASAAQTKKAYTAVTSKGKITDFSYLVWNDMCAKVLEMREYYGYSWRTDYLSYSNTRMSSSNKNMTAARFNSLRVNVGSLISTGISEVSSGDIIYGSYFTTLMSKVNQKL